MNKKVMALAVAGALAAPAALAQVQIGGGIHLQYFNNDSGSDASKKTDILTTSEPEIYFRGEEKLGGGLSTWFQCTSSFDVLGQGLGAWCGRNSAIGFRGDFGNAFAGTWDTPHKLVSNLARGWWGGTNVLQGGTLQLLANGSDSNVGNDGSSFFRRQRRSINYHSPDWGGFNLLAAFSSGNEATAEPESGSAKPRMYSVAGQFRTGPFFAGLGYEKHNDFGLVLGSDTSFNVAAGFTFAGAIKVSALYMSAEYKPDAGFKVEHDGFALYLDWSLGGPHKLYAQFATRSDLDVDGASQSDTGGDAFGVAYGYSFSKRTQGYIAYNELKPDQFGVDNEGNNLTNTSITAGATSAGAKMKVIGVGLRHSF
jgi:predicted porin